MTEQQIQAKILKRLKMVGAYSIKVIAANRAGVGDIVGCLPPSGKFFMIEVKRPGKKPSALQLRHKFEVERAGGIWLKAVNWEDLSCLS